MPSLLEQHAPAVQARRSLRPHQARSRDRVLHQLSIADRTLLVSACGTGKTITLHAIAERSGARRIAAFFPSLALVDQTLIEWGIQYGGRMRAIVVCSDDTVGQRFKVAARNDEVAISDDEFAAAGAQVIRNVDELSLVLRTHDTADLPLVVFSTYQSSDKVAAAQVNTGIWFDLAIADEAHKLAVRDRENVTVRAGKLVLDADAILTRKRVFATATPKTFTYSTTSENHRGAEASMDDTGLFGAVADTVGLREAIDRSLLTDYRIHIMGVNPAAADANAAIDDEDSTVRMALGVAALKRAQEELGVTRVIAYLSSRARANEFAQLVNDTGIAECSVITGDQPAGERKPKLDALAEDGGVIANVRCLTEGVDVPSLDAVLFVDPRTSKIDIVQAVGRAIRNAPGKTLGHVILPVLHDPGTPEEGWLTGNSYGGVWDVIAQMAENDTEVRSHLNHIAEHGNREPADGDQFDIIQAHPAGASTGGPEALAFTRQLVLRAAALNDPLGNEWRDSADAAGAFARVNGRHPRQQASNPEERRLGTWVITQRSGFRTGALAPNRRAYLTHIYPNWLRDPEQEWIDSAHAVGEFVRTYGRDPRQKAKDAEEKRLGMWLVDQRVAGRAGKLTAARHSALDQSYPGWLRDAEKEWQDAAAAAGEFVRVNGRNPSKAAKNLDERRLGAWVGNQRMAARAGKMSAERKAHLAIVYPGCLRDPEQEWCDNADAAGAFFAQERRHPSAKAKNPDEKRLGAWVVKQRTAARRGSFTAERAVYLDRAYPGWLPTS